MANVETNEAMFPIRYLFRRRMRDSGGAGEFRGGTGGEYAITPHDGDGGLGFVVSGKGVDFPMGHGLGGGYPGAPGRYVIARGAQGEGKSLEEGSGTHESVSWGVYTLKKGDVLYVRWNGAGGIGDPLRRSERAVAADVTGGAVSPAAAQAIYGVAVSEAGEIDAARTQRLRASRMRLGDAGREMLPGACRHCGLSTGKFRVAERAMRELGPVYTTGPRTVLREFFCPECGSLADAQVALAGDEVLNDQTG